MTWQPGQPILSASDDADWQAWRKARKLEQQRDRRQRHPRIDYTPSNAAREAIRARTFHCVGGDQSSVIDQLVLRAAGLAPE